MPHHAATTLAFVCALLLGGCANGTDSVLFVTKSSLGIDADTKPASLSVSVDRVEGYLGPRYDNGAVPPVFAFIDSDGSMVGGKVKQLYATGRAANNLVAEKEVGGNGKSARPELSGGKKAMFFGTTTTVGFKVGFTAQTPDSVILGYRRKEASYVPLGTTKNDKGQDVDTYGSVLASIDLNATASQSETGLRNRQFFATGAVAEALARDDQIQRLFKNTAKEAVKLSSAAKSLLTERIADIETILGHVVASDGKTVDAAKLKALLQGTSVEDSDLQSFADGPLDDLDTALHVEYTANVPELADKIRSTA